jgi:hypothetical protein
MSGIPPLQRTPDVTFRDVNGGHFVHIERDNPVTGAKEHVIVCYNQLSFEEQLHYRNALVCKAIIDQSQISASCDRLSDRIQQSLNSSVDSKNHQRASSEENRGNATFGSWIASAVTRLCEGICYLFQRPNAH